MASDEGTSPPTRNHCLADEPPPCMVLRQTTTARPWRRRGIAALRLLVWLYLAAVLGVWLTLWLGGDRWWPATVLLFGPRWPYALPWPVLAIAAAFTRRRLLWPLLVAGVVLAGPIAGLCLPWATVLCPAGTTLRVLTCNIDGHTVDTQRFMELVADARPDVIALQECPSDLPVRWPEGWHVRHAGELLIASRYPLRNVEQSQRRHPPSLWPAINSLWCTLETPRGPIGFCCLHLRTPRDELSETLDRQTGVSLSRSAALIAGTVDRRLESRELSSWLTGDTIVAGDFNMPADSAIYREFWSPCRNAFSTSGFGFGYSKWTPVGRWSYGLRIDHILMPLSMTARRCWLGPDVGSDHLPVLADVVVE